MGCVLSRRARRLLRGDEHRGFDHAGVRGAVVHGTSKPRPALRGWTAGLPTLIFMLYTPKGLSKVACVAEPTVVRLLANVADMPQPKQT